MTIRALAAALALAACSPPAPSEPAQDAAASAPNAALLSAAPAAGQWFFRGDAGVIGAGFGAPQSEYQFSITCEAPTGKLTLISSHELAPDQETTLTLLTPTQSLDLPARSFNEGLPSVTAELSESAPQRAALVAALTPPQDRFGVEIAGEITVFPWDEAIARALAACA